VTREPQNSAWALVSLACGVAGPACLFLEWLLPGLCTYDPALVCFQLKEKSQACGGNLGSIEELRGAIYLAEEACPGISDTMVAQLVQRLQR